MALLAPPESVEPRDVLRGLRGALNGSGPALALGVADDFTPRDVPAGTAVVVRTSGSTGYPKSVVLSRSALTSSALATAERLGDGAWLLALPAHYVAGVQVLVRSLVAGREPAVLSGTFSAQSFAAAALSMASSEGGEAVPTFTSLVPAQLATLLDAAEAHTAHVEAALQSFAAILIGGQALPVRERERAARLGVRVIRTYGSSETSGGCVYNGQPLPGVRTRIVDGEIHLAGPMLAEGYLDDPERTAQAFTTDAAGTRWYRTGDAGHIDGNNSADATLSVDGRLDNVIVSGGINVSLDRVERYVTAVPGWEEAVVVAVTDERWGEASVVIVSADVPPPEVSFDALREQVAAHLGLPARPARVLVAPSIARLPTGKPDRLKLQAWVRNNESR